MPVFKLGFELLSPRSRQRVVLGTSIIFRSTPIRLNPALVLKPVERGIEGPLSNLKGVLGYLADSLCNTPSMHGRKCERSQNKQIQSSME